jgi:hypothetical protein
VDAPSTNEPAKRVSGHDTRALQAYLGHKNIQHTVRYTELAPRSVQKLLAVKGAPNGFRDSPVRLMKVGTGKTNP